MRRHFAHKKKTTIYNQHIHIMEDTNDLSAPLLKVNQHDLATPPPQPQTLSKSRNTHHRRRSEVVKRSIRTRFSHEEYHTNNEEELPHALIFDRTSSSIASVTASVDTERISNTNIDELPMLEHKEELPVSTLTKIKTVVVILTTIVAIVAYCISFEEILVLFGSGVSSVDLAILGAAAGICVLVTPVVWLNEWKLIRYPGESINKADCLLLLALCKCISEKKYISNTVHRCLTTTKNKQ